MFDFVGLAGERADHPDAGQVLLQAGGERALRFVGDLELRTDLGEEVVGAGDDERHEHESQAREPGVAGEQDRGQHTEQQERATDLHHLRGQEDPHRLHVRTAALDEIAGVRLVEEAGRQMLHAFVHRLAKPAGQRLRRDGGPAPLQVLARGTECGEADAGHGGEDEIGDVRFSADGCRQRGGSFDEHDRALRQVLGVHHVEDVAAHQWHAEHEGAREAGDGDGGRIPQALTGGDSPEVS